MNASELSSKSGPELVAIYNAIPGVSPVKRFTNRETGVRRILKTLASSPSTIVATVDVEPAATVEEQPAKEKSSRGPSATPGQYDLPRKDIIRAHRENSGRGRLIDALKEGRSWSQLREQFTQWTDAQLHKTIRMLNWYLGYAVKTDEAGVITINE